MRDVCPGCGLRFEREPGYWVGAVTINTTVTFGFFVTLFVTLTMLNWPDPPWVMIMAVTVAANLLLPVFFHPVSRTIWAAMEISWHPLEPKDFNR
jgi:hypothetical protein